MRRGGRNTRPSLLIALVLVCIVLIVTSVLGILTPLEDLIAQPLHVVTGFFNRIALTTNQFLNDFSDIQILQERIADLEEQLALQNAEVIELREVASDYQRLSGLLQYTSSVDNQEFLAADVIYIDQQSALRVIVINRGTRDGLAVGMPVVTQLGLVGRIINVSANAARVQLVTDENSAISARLQTSRAVGTIIGLPTGNMRLTFIPLGAEIAEGDLVITSGLGGNLPADLVIGQVTGTRSFEAELFQEAEVRSLIDFSALETVLVITNFQPVDISVFKEAP